MLLSGRDDIAVVCEASNFVETVQKTAELHPDLIILDLNLPDRDRIPSTEVRSLLNGARVLAMSFGSDDLDEGLLDSIGAIELLDKMDLRAAQKYLRIFETNYPNRLVPFQWQMH